MASLNSLKMRSLAAQTTGIRNTEDAAVAMRITNPGHAVTHVIVAADTIELHDSSGTDTITLSTTGTLGAVVDAINALPNWRCKLLDSLRSQICTTNSTLMAGTLTANTKYGEVGYDVLLSTTVAFTYPIRVTYDRTAGNLLPAGGHRVKLVSFDYVLDVGAAAANMVKIYEWDPILRIETQIWQAASVDSTTTVTSADFSKAPITAKEGNDLIVLVTDAASITSAATTNYIQALYIRE
jgi:hypothetical protein